MDRYSVNSVEQHDNPPHWRVFFDVSGPDGSKVHGHVIPVDAFGWRAAEYGIDPADIDTLLDVVLHEVHMTNHDHMSADFLYNTDQESARRALHSRVAEVKNRIQIHDPHGHLDQIRRAHTVDQTRHEERKLYTDHVRRHGAAPALHLPPREDLSSG